MNFVQSKDGTKIAYTNDGKGPPLLLVHGTLGERSIWSKVVPGLSKEFTVHAMDRRGRGASGDAAEYALEREAEDIAACVTKIGAQVNVLGHSYGAVCSLQAMLLTDRVRRLALYEPLLRTGPVETTPTPELDAIEALAAKGEREAALRAFFRDVFKTPPEQIEKIKSLPYWDERLTVIHTAPRENRASRAYRFPPERFRTMEVPTLLMLGGDSPAHFPAGADMLRAALPHTETTILPGQQHQAMSTAPDLFVSEVVRFFKA